MKYIFILFLLYVNNSNCFGQKIKQTKLDNLILSSTESHSDALIIYKDGKLITETYFGKEAKQIDIKSITKSITNLAIGYLVTNGKLNIDQKVHEFYPEWNQENKNGITIKHLLTHTSGILDSDFSLVESTQDILSLALASDLTHPVGKFYVYNNKAVNLLAGIIEKVDKRKLDVLMEEEIFKPLGISDFLWPKDEIGNPYAMAFLQMYPEDIIKIGQFVLNKGEWKGKQLIDSSWFDVSMRPGAHFLPEYGLLWELITKNFRFVVDDLQISKMKEASVQPSIIDKMSKMKGTYDGYGKYYGKLREVFGKEFNVEFMKKLVPFGLSVGRKEIDGVIGYAGIGYLGQYLVIYPKHNLIAFRGINNYKNYNWTTDEMPNFPKLVLELIED